MDIKLEIAFLGGGRFEATLRPSLNRLALTLAIGETSGAENWIPIVQHQDIVERYFFNINFSHFQRDISKIFQSRTETFPPPISILFSSLKEAKQHCIAALKVSSLEMEEKTIEKRRRKGSLLGSG